jgi:hypothetical protein
VIAESATAQQRNRPLKELNAKAGRGGKANPSSAGGKNGICNRNFILILITQLKVLQYDSFLMDFF